MVQETKRFLAYICPHCAQSVIVERNLFSLAAAPVHIKCPCGKSELGIEFKPNRVQMTVPCLFCGREHTVSCSSRAFSCAASGLDCCYVGEEARFRVSIDLSDLLGGGDGSAAPSPKVSPASTAKPAASSAVDAEKQRQKEQEAAY